MVIAWLLLAEGGGASPRPLVRHAHDVGVPRGAALAGNATHLFSYLGIVISLVLILIISIGLSVTTAVGRTGDPPAAAVVEVIIPPRRSPPARGPHLGPPLSHGRSATGLGVRAVMPFPDTVGTRTLRPPAAPPCTVPLGLLTTGLLLLGAPRTTDSRPSPTREGPRAG